MRISTDDQGTKCRRNIAENYNRLSRVHERYRRQTDGRATAYSEREREFTTSRSLKMLCTHDTYHQMFSGDYFALLTHKTEIL